MSITPWKTLKTESFHPGIRVDTCELPDGQIIHAHVLEYDDEVIVFALNKHQEVILIKQYRHGVQKDIVELPGGSVDEGESPLEAAKRELMEETGYASSTWIEVGFGSPNPAIYTNRIYSFLAMDVEQTGRQSAYDAETLEVLFIPLDETIAMAKRGELSHSLNISTLFLALGYLDWIS